MGYGSAIHMAPAKKLAVIILANRSGATLPATTEKAFELLTDLQPRPAPPTRESLPITPDDLARLPGLYRNGDQTLEIAARTNRLILRRGAAELPLVKRAPNRLAQENGGAEYQIVAAPNGKPEYLLQGTRAYSRAK
jgi:CubicO group peptidase (beta-lactamase class C family)